MLIEYDNNIRPDKAYMLHFVKFVNRMLGIIIIITDE